MKKSNKYTYNEMKSIIELVKNEVPIEFIIKKFYNSKIFVHDNYSKCLCPFHDDHHPDNFCIVLDNTYYCYACSEDSKGRHGDVIQLTEHALNLSMKEAVLYLKDIVDSGEVNTEEYIELKKEKKEKLKKFLAERLNPNKKRTPKRTLSKIKSTSNKSPSKNIVTTEDDEQDFWEDFLKGPAFELELEKNKKIKEIYKYFFSNLLNLTQAGKEYLFERGFKEEILRGFHVRSLNYAGYVFKELLKKFNMDDLVDSGLVIKDKERFIFAFSKPCIIFTSFVDGEPVYFISRNPNVQDSKNRFSKPKNIPQILFAGNLNDDIIFHFESCTDAMAFTQFTKNTHVSSESGLTANIINEYPDKKFIIVFDKDKSGRGQNAADAILKKYPGRAELFNYDKFIQYYDIPVGNIAWKDMNDLLQIKLFGYIVKSPKIIVPKNKKKKKEPSRAAPS